MTIGDMCKRDAVWVEAEDSAVEIAERMRREHVGCVVVAEESAGRRKTLGIVTDRDLAMLLLAQDVDPDQVRASDIMSAPVHLCHVGDQLSDAIAFMHANSVRRLPVLDAEEHLVGLVSHEDILRELAVELAYASVLGEGAIREEIRRYSASPPSAAQATR